ncbi:MAG: tetratricopeptide repeat protein [Gemmatimonadota bacterium]|nr:tetratricopeptide repeat protein [Gemmatimonadota bacterium]
MTSPTHREFVLTFGVVLAAVAGFLFLDTALAKLDRTETTSHAASNYESGVTLMRQGRTADATEALRAAWNLDRTHIDYPVALSAAILAGGRASEAENLLSPVLAANATDGPANLEMARILTAERRYEAAASYYHRAIYGLWSGNADSLRSATRFELIDLISAHGSRQELLSELLPVQSDSTLPPKVRRRIGHLLLAAGSPDRAATVFRELLRLDDSDADAYAGMGESAAARGNLRTARADFEEALRISPSDSALRVRAAVIDSALALDPTERGLGPAAAASRSSSLLSSTLDFTRRCTELTPTSELSALVDSAGAVLARPRPAAAATTDSDLRVELSQEIWKRLPLKCVLAPEPRDQPLALAQSRISQ